MSLQIRVAKQTDLPAITEIYNQAIESGTSTADIAAVWLGGGEVGHFFQLLRRVAASCG